MVEFFHYYHGQIRGRISIFFQRYGHIDPPSFFTAVEESDENFPWAGTRWSKRHADLSFFIYIQCTTTTDH